MEGFHRDLVSPAVLELISLIFEGQVVLDGTAGELGLLVLPRSQRGSQSPESHQNGNCGEQAEKDGGLQATTDFPCHIGRDHKENGEKQDVGEAVVSSPVCGEGCIFDSRILFREAH